MAEEEEEEEEDEDEEEAVPTLLVVFFEVVVKYKRPPSTCEGLACMPTRVAIEHQTLNFDIKFVLGFWDFFRLFPITCCTF